MRWIGRISAADIVTLLNGLTGFLAITYILDGEMVIASCLIILAIVFDGVDGAFARRFGSSHEFGKFLDSISDSVSFGFAPALLVYGNLYDRDLGSAWVSMPNALAVISSMFLGCFGVLRLAKFSALDSEKPFFMGFPTPAMALGTVMICSLFGREGFNPLTTGFNLHLIAFLSIILAFLMVSEIRYPKMNRVFFILSGFTGLMVALPLLILAFNINIQGRGFLTKLHIIGLILFLAYLIVGPLLIKAGIVKGRSRAIKS